MSVYLQGTMNKYFIVFATLFLSVGKGIICRVYRRDLIEPAGKENLIGLRLKGYQHYVVRRGDDEDAFGSEFSFGSGMDFTTTLSATSIEDESMTEPATQGKCPEAKSNGAIESLAAISACLLVINIILLVMLHRLYHIKMSPPSGGNGNKKSTYKGKGMEMNKMPQNAYEVAKENTVTGKDNDSSTYEELQSPNAAADERRDEREEEHINTDIYEDVEDDNDDEMVYQNV
ncbi:uncharacterized protein [Ptychodera flava]|uniref:uncharacterized protein n=1 Tax=Ptychodera flava TaxID=63121 RepID=UPI00396AAB50